MRLVGYTGDEGLRPTTRIRQRASHLRNLLEGGIIVVASGLRNRSRRVALGLADPLGSGSAMARPLKGKLILVADDDDDNAELAVGILTFEGAKVRKAVTGHQAADILASWRPHVLVIDLAMPEMDGCRLLRLARSDLGLGDVPAIAATAHAFDHFKRAAKEAGSTNSSSSPTSRQRSSKR